MPAMLALAYDARYSGANNLLEGIWPNRAA